MTAASTRPTSTASVTVTDASICHRWPNKQRYFSERHAMRACSGIARKLADRGRLDGPLAPYPCDDGGYQHWHLGRPR